MPLSVVKDSDTIGFNEDAERAFLRVRTRSESLCNSLSAEDPCVQSVNLCQGKWY
jgi:hypothetical protein